MSDKETAVQQIAIDRFWHNYLSILEKHSVPERSRPWYRKHAEMYISSHKSIRLAEHTQEMVECYLPAKGRLPNLKEWQFRQVADALRLLFCDLLNPHWAAEYDWN